MTRTQTNLLAILILLAGPALWADEPNRKVSSRFQQAESRSFLGFDAAQEQVWQAPFFFIQLADPQYGMFTGNTGLEKEQVLVQQAVAHINRLQPRFVIVCGDLTNATPDHARYAAQVSQYHQDFSQIDPEIPLVCVCGNHDVGNRPTATSIDRYRDNFGDDYFSFWVGGVFNVVLNSSLLKDPAGAPDRLLAQQKWLDQQLNNPQVQHAKHVLVFLHHPLFLEQADEPDQYFNIPLERRLPLLEQFKQAQVRAIFAGHYHRNAYGRAGDLEMITTGPVGRPLGKDPSGLRIVKIEEADLQHEYYPLEDVPAQVE
ncbi:metallophosphoesterase [Aureliella helgolandensis]|uniref:Serine/threonine-protein phosphatase CPPED1 n=1 Tax=Aureliella helgolandensis TaxID=2527968 RepID=A0A518G8T6_9BACT|nr:metallophosphoesterase [Aureliella helgolandensis]QDV24982.1 Calcineurin-like phosphoesterase superfamily domain protein [Aureliella helgolandensis]